ncbi:hypothetical protein [Amycolatopsis sp. NPDC004079]|uniref:ApeA N-terminal domain 1-containing protein n=1 Tax=Amycolatopsis sp. NPDC004079 TaxID=3154549 RepID=UPI00339E662B
MNKNQLLSVGEYPLEWRLADGSSVPGVLTLAGAETVTGTAYGLPAEPPSHEDAARARPSWTVWEPGVKPYGVVRGELRNNLDIALPDACVSHQLPGHSVLLASLAMIGPKLRDNRDLVFDEITFQVEGLTELSGVAPLKEYKIPQRLADDATYGGTWNGESTQEWTNHGGDRVRMHYVASFAAPQGYKLSFTTAPVITVSGRPRPLDEWMNTYVRPSAELAGFAVNRPQAITFVTVEREGVGHASVYGRELSQQRFDAEQAAPGAMPALVRCGPGRASMPDLIGRWSAMKRDYPVFADYLTSIPAPGLPITARFTALMASLESFHTIKYGAGPLGKKEFSREKNNVMKEIRNSRDVSEVNYDWLRRWGNFFGTYELRERLRALHAGLPRALQDLVNAAVEPVPDLLADVVANPEDIWHIAGKARNNLAHGNTPQTNEQLSLLTQLGNTLAVGHVLSLLGAPADPFAAAITRGDWRLE